MSDIGSSNYSETDASNNQAPPGGWPEGMNPSDVNNSARANMGATKRFWNQINAVKTSGGATTAFTLTYDVAACALYDGELVSFVADRDCVAAATMNKNGLGAKAINKFSKTTATWVAVENSDWLANQVVILRYNLSDTTWQLVHVSLSILDFVALAANNTFTGTNVFSGTVTLTKPLAGTTVRGYLAGLTTSNNSGTPNTKIDVAAGVAADSTNAVMLSSAGGTIDCGTTGVNGLDAGSLANSTWYFPFVIGKTDGTMALLASTSLSAPTMPSGYTLKRRIGAFLTDSSAHIIAFLQDGDEFEWVTPPNDVSVTNPGTSAISRTLTVPAGLNTRALIQAILQQGDASVVSAYFSDLATTDINPATTFADMANAANAADPVMVKYIRTNTNRQIRSRLNGSNGNTTLTINTLGWIDRRGRDS